MRTSRRITRAYCVELKDVVTIPAARRAFFQMPEPRSRFLFLCSSECCRQLSTPPQITGVNYHIHVSEDGRVDDSICRRPHFKENNRYEHHTDCEWVEDDGEADATPRQGETAADAKARVAKRSLKAIVDIFDPGQDDEEVMPKTTGDGAHPPRQVSEGRARGNSKSSGGAGGRRESKVKSKDLEALVDHYCEARDSFDLETFKRIMLEVKGRGVISLRSYFLPSEYAKTGVGGHVYWGRGYLLPRNGDGLELQLFNKTQNKSATITVPPEVVKAAKSQSYIEQILSEHRQFKHFTFYVLGVFTPVQEKEGMTVELKDLRRLVIRRGPLR